MTDFQPLRESSSSAFERELLRSADRDEPSPRSFARAAAALGVGALVSSTATPAAAGSAASLATFWTMALKPLLIGAAGGLVVAVSAQKLSAPSEPAKLETPVLPAATAATSDPPPLPAASFRPSLPLPAASLVPAVPAGPHPVSPGTAPTPDAVSIAREIAIVDRARLALREGRPNDALRELELYRVGWPHGVLATEAQVLSIEAYLALGNRTSALRAARAFLTTEPSGRYAARVRSLFQAAELEP